jgi:signal transduction histidine kinase
LLVYFFQLKPLIANVVFVIGFTLNLSSQNQIKIDSLKNKLGTASNENKFVILNQLFKQYNQTDYKTALVYATEFNDLAIQVADSVKIVEGGRMKAYSLMDLGENDSAIDILLQVLDIAERNKSRSPELKKQVKFILNNIGIANTYIGNYDRALEYHFKSLQIREEEGDKKSIHNALNNIGLVFYNLKDYKKAIEFYLRALDMKKETKDNFDLEGLLINIGLCYNQSGDYEKAISYFNQGFKACQNNCSDNIRGVGLSGLGAAYYHLKDWDKAEDCLLKSLEISRTQGNMHNQWSALYQLSLIEISHGKKDKGLSYLKEALKIAEQSNLADPLIDTYKKFSEFYSESSDDKNYALYLSKYVKLKDSIYSEELIKNLAKVQTNYAERENIKTIKEKNEVLALKELLIERQRTQTVFIVAIMVLVMGMAAILLWANTKQRKISRELNKSKLELEDRVLARTQDLKKSNELLAKAKSDLDNFLYKTSHDIRGPLATLKGLNNLAIDSTDNLVMTKDLLDKKNTQIDKLTKILSRITIVTNISKTLHVAQQIDFKEMIDEIIAFEKKNGQLKHIKVFCEVEPGFHMVSDPNLIRLILENMIDNSLKFFNESQRIEPYAKISVTSAGSNALIRIEDNGVGITMKPHQDVFSMFMRGSEKSETGGVGLYLCKVCTDKLHGVIKLEKTDKNGTTFLVRLALDATAMLNEMNAILEAEMKEEERREEEYEKQIKAGLA